MVFISRKKPFIPPNLNIPPNSIFQPKLRCYQSELWFCVTWFWLQCSHFCVWSPEGSEELDPETTLDFQDPETRWRPGFFQAQIKQWLEIHTLFGKLAYLHGFIWGNILVVYAVRWSSKSTQNLGECGQSLNLPASIFHLWNGGDKCLHHKEEMRTKGENMCIA